MRVPGGDGSQCLASHSWRGQSLHPMPPLVPRSLKTLGVDHSTGGPAAIPILFLLMIFSPMDDFLSPAIRR